MNVSAALFLALIYLAKSKAGAIGLSNIFIGWDLKSTKCKADICRNRSHSNTTNVVHTVIKAFDNLSYPSKL